MGAQTGRRTRAASWRQPSPASKPGPDGSTPETELAALGALMPEARAPRRAEIQWLAGHPSTSARAALTAGPTHACWRGRSGLTQRTPRLCRQSRRRQLHRPTWAGCGPSPPPREAHTCSCPHGARSALVQNQTCEGLRLLLSLDTGSLTSRLTTPAPLLKRKLGTPAPRAAPPFPGTPRPCLPSARHGHRPAEPHHFQAPPWTLGVPPAEPRTPATAHAPGWLFRSSCSSARMLGRAGLGAEPGWARLQGGPVRSLGLGPPQGNQRG